MNLSNFTLKSQEVEKISPAMTQKLKLQQIENDTSSNHFW